MPSRSGRNKGVNERDFHGIDNNNKLAEVFNNKKVNLMVNRVVSVPTFSISLNVFGIRLIRF